MPSSSRTGRSRSSSRRWSKLFSIAASGGAADARAYRRRRAQAGAPPRRERQTSGLIGAPPRSALAMYQHVICLRSTLKVSSNAHRSAWRSNSRRFSAATTTACSLLRLARFALRHRLLRDRVEPPRHFPVRRAPRSPPHPGRARARRHRPHTPWTTMATASISGRGEPQPRPRVEPQLCHQRGSNTLSETKAIRRGISSSRMRMQRGRR